MRGYKCIPYDGICIEDNSGFKYELAMIYEYYPRIPLIPGKQGFNFCERAEDLHKHYDCSKFKIYTIEALGNIVGNDGIRVTDKILIKDLV